ncbi:hypothetical protein MRX96_021989 [Rhipicephalus microplus]
MGEIPQADSKGALLIACTLFADACEVSVQVSFLPSEQPAKADAIVAALRFEGHKSNVFYGYEPLVDKENDDALRDLTSVTIPVFLSLLHLMLQGNARSSF